MKFKAIFALLITILLWSIHAIIAKKVIKESPPFTLHFFRMVIASFAFLPIFILGRLWRKPGIFKLIGISLFASINLIFFMWGIQFTTASASQLIYAFIPILVITIGSVFLREKYPTEKIIGVFLGFFGLVYIIYRSGIEHGATITGNIIGNLAIFFAMSGWTLYLIFSKKISKFFSPYEIGSVSILTTLVVSTPLFLLENYSLVKKEEIFLNNFWAIFYMGFFGTFLAYIFYQYAIKHVSPLTVGLSSYLQPVTTTFLAMIFLGELPTFHFILGSFCIFFGIFLTSSFRFFSWYKRR